MNRKLQLAVIGLSVVAAFALEGAAEPPGSTRHLDPRFLQECAEYSQKRGGLGLLIRHRGHTLVEEYAPGMEEVRFPVLSITKGLIGLVALSAQADGLLALNEPVSQSLPGWNNSSATLGDLLNFSAPLPSGAEIFYRRGKKNNRLAVEQIRPAVTVPPGIDFTYGPAGYEIFGEILRNRLAGKNQKPLYFLQNRLLARFGASVSGWRMDDAGNPYFSTGARLTIRGMADLGDLLLQPPNPFRSSSHPARFLTEIQSGQIEDPFFYLGFWRNLGANRPGFQEVDIEQWIGNVSDRQRWRTICISKRAPDDLLALIGSGGQRIYLVPSLDLVIARTGRAGNGFSDREFLAKLFR